MYSALDPVVRTDLHGSPMQPVCQGGYRIWLTRVDLPATGHAGHGHEQAHGQADVWPARLFCVGFLTVIHDRPERVQGSSCPNRWTELAAKILAVTDAGFFRTWSACFSHDLAGPAVLPRSDVHEPVAASMVSRFVLYDDQGVADVLRWQRVSRRRRLSL